MGKIPLWRTDKPTIWTRVGTDVFGPFWVKKTDPTKAKADDDQNKTIKTYDILWTDSQDDIHPVSPSLLTIGREIEILEDYHGLIPKCTLS